MKYPCVTSLALMLACGKSGALAGGGTGSAATTTTVSTSSAGTDGNGSADATTTTEAATTVAATMDTTSAPTTSSEGSTGKEDSTGMATMPDLPTMLPTPTSECPALGDGDVMFSPDGIESRQVRLWMSDAASELDGPIVFYWHASSSGPEEALFGLSSTFVDQVVAQGGIVAAPYHDPAAGPLQWFLASGQEEHDLLVADEVLACAIEQVGVDVSRIHVSGMSAGGVQASQMSFRRSGYVASVGVYSGGFVGDTPPDQDPRNPLSAMIFHGGKSDVSGISFEDTSNGYLEDLEARGGFGFICNHGMGHTIPQGDAQSSVWQFFYDHPFGTTPSPYAGGLPRDFPDYCAL